MQIERVTIYRVLGRDFPTLKKAQDHVEETIYNIVKEAMLAQGYSIREAIKFTEMLMARRHDLADLLACTNPEESEE